VPGQSPQLLSTAADAARVGLAVASLRATGRLRLAVAGSSMLPAIRPRDVLLVRRCDFDSVRKGDVVLFCRGDRVFAHRVIECAPHAMVTRGDAIAEADEPVGTQEFLGRVERVVRRGRAFRPRNRAAITSAIFRRSPRAGRYFTRLDGLAWSLAR